MIQNYINKTLQKIVDLNLLLEDMKLMLLIILQEMENIWLQVSLNQTAVSFDMYPLGRSGNIKNNASNGWRKLGNKKIINNRSRFKF